MEAKQQVNEQPVNDEPFLTTDEGHKIYHINGGMHIQQADGQLVDVFTAGETLFQRALILESVLRALYDWYRDVLYISGKLVDIEEAARKVVVSSGGPPDYIHSRNVEALRKALNKYDEEGEG